jgi:hypothetical protein
MNTGKLTIKMKSLVTPETAEKLEEESGIYSETGT